MENSQKIILASTSPIRRQMMNEAELIYEARSPICDEEEVKLELKNQNLSLSALALELAKAKAKSVSIENPEYFVIGSDQICELEGGVISKSRNTNDAYTSLEKLQGKTHKQNNGTCIYLNGEFVMGHSELVLLTMKPLSDKQIKDYIKLDDPIGCAGSYKFELNGYKLFSQIIGTDECIKGFCISKIIEFFESRN